MLFTDPKGELFEYTSKFYKNLGYEVRAIDFKNPKKSDHYNFLQQCIKAINDNDMPLAVDRIWDITSTLVGEAKGEKLWTNGEASAIASSIMLILYENRFKPELQNFTNVYHFINNMCKSDNEGNMPLTKYLKTLPEEHPARALFGTAEIAPERTRGSFFTSALTTLRLFTNPNTYNITSESDFDICDLSKKKFALFIILPDETKTYFELASLFTSLTYLELVRYSDLECGGRLPRKVFFLLDEFGNFPKIAGFDNMLTVGAGRGILFYIFIQGYMQLDATYGKEVSQTIQDNTMILNFLKTGSIDTAELISKRLGTYTCLSGSVSNSSNSRSYDTSSISRSSNLISRPLLTAEEVMRIKRPNVLVMEAGEKPLVSNIPDVSQWYFNKMFGMGSKKHNEKLRIERQKERQIREQKEIKIWKVWEEEKKREENLKKLYETL